jgi:hypothetical protein
MQADHKSERRIPAPWLRFFRAVEAELETPIEIHCIGGFAVLAHGVDTRQTGDVDVIDAVPADDLQALLALAGHGSELFKKYGLYIQMVGVTEAPCDYHQRLIDITPRGFETLAIKILDPNDVVLTKLARHWERDREDARVLADHGLLDPGALEQRFEKEIRPYLQVKDAARASLTLELWLGEFFPEYERRRRSDRS